MNELIGRAYLEQAVKRAQRRNAARLVGDAKLRAERMRDDAAMFIADHPFAAVAGGLALGIVIGLALPRMRFGKAVSGLLAEAAQAGIVYSRKAWESAQEAGARIHDVTDKADEQA